MWFVRLLFLHARWCLTHRVIQKWVWCKDSHLSALALLLFSTRLHQLNYNSPSCGQLSQYALRMFSQRSLLKGDLPPCRPSYFRDTHTHTQTHTPEARERKTCSARKQVDDQTGLTEAVWCLYRDLVLEICFTYSTLTALPLNSECEGDGYFRSEPGPVTQPFCFLKEQLPGTGMWLVLKKDLALIAQQYIFIGTPWHKEEMSEG